MSEDINAVEVHTKMTTERAGMVRENFVVKTEREGNWPLWCCYTWPHIQSPAPHLALTRSTSQVMMTVAGKRGKATSFLSVALAWREKDEVLLVPCY